MMHVVGIDVRLRPMRLDDEAAVLAAHEAMRGDDFAFVFDHDPSEPWAQYVRRVDAQRSWSGVSDGRVPATFLLAAVGSEVVGRASIRHELNEYLATIGGHIGYCVLPDHRRRGIATEILRQSLIIARSLGIDRVLVTCDEDNVGSATVIERCGGVLESIVHDPSEGVSKRRYWIA
jgi:predicted acetyltransferase